MTIESIRQASSLTTWNEEERNFDLKELVKNLSSTLETYGSRRLNGFGYFAIAVAPIAVPILICFSNFLAEQSPLSRITKRSVETTVELEDGTLGVKLLSSVGNPRKGNLSLEINHLSKLVIERTFGGDDREVYSYLYNHNFTISGNNVLWIHKRYASIEEIRAGRALLAVVDDQIKSR